MTEFIEGAAVVAASAIRRVAPPLEADFVTVIKFLVDNPDSARAYRGGLPGSEEYIALLATKYASARAPKFPQVPSTVPDPAVSVVLQSFFHVAESDLDRIKTEHQLSMAAENLVGDILERYIAENMEQSGWVWCAGAFVKSIDFIRPVGTGWESLQVKNRDNSENSSSAQVRQGTSISKWHRTASRTGFTNWAKFPAPIGHSLTEEGFLDFISDYFESNDLNTEFS